MTDRICVLLEIVLWLKINIIFSKFVTTIKLSRHRYVTKHTPPYAETQNGFQLFINLMKTSDTDEMRDVACFYLSCN